MDYVLDSVPVMRDILLDRKASLIVSSTSLILFHFVFPYFSQVLSEFFPGFDEFIFDA